MSDDWVIEQLHICDTDNVRRLARFVGADDSGARLDVIIAIEDELADGGGE